MIQKVERSNIIDKKTNKERKLSYRDVEYDANGFACASKFLPADYDLCEIMSDKRTYPGWIEGKHWEGANVPTNIKVLKWKRNYFHDED